MFNKSINGLFLLVISFALTACGGGNSTTEPTILTESTVSGNIQKGPFITLISMKAIKLNTDGSESNESKDLADNEFKGNGLYQGFNLPWVGWTRFTAEGTYFNEKTGTTTDVVTLTAVQNLTGINDVVNLNLFTTLADELLKKSLPLGASSNLASSQQDIFNSLKNSLGLSTSDFSSLDLTKPGNDNAILLLFSGAYLSSGGDIATLVSDFEDNAIFDTVENTIYSEGGTSALFNQLSSKLTTYIEGQGESSTVPTLPTNENLPTWANNQTGSVSIAGNTTQGQTLTATVSDLDGVPETIAYQWKSAGNNVGTNSKTYVLTQSDVGNTITVVATYTDGQDTQETVTSSATATITNVNDNGAVSISGNTTQGQTLTATVTDLDGVPETIAYQWKSAGSNVGTNSNTYVLTQSDVGNTITVEATYTDGQNTQETITSNATATIANVNDNGAVSIAGNTTQGQTLTATVTDLDGVPETIAYQWKSAGSNVGTNSKTYVLTQSDVGNTITVVATYTDGQNTQETVTSSATLAIISSVVQPSPITQLNDTGLLSDEDGQVGRDATNNDDTNGFAGFDFTRLAADGSASTDGNFSCVKDNVTGLIWEKKTTDGGLHDKDHKYTWYDPDTSPQGFALSSETLIHSLGTNNTCAGFDENNSATFCNTKAYVDRVNAAGLCGATDWRLPSREELRSLVLMNDMTKADSNPAIDSTYFPNTQPSYKVDCADIIYSDLPSDLKSKDVATFTPSDIATTQGVIDNLLINDTDFSANCANYGTNTYTNPNNTRGRGVGYATSEKGSLSTATLWTLFFDDLEIDHEITYHELKYVRLVRGEKLLDSSSPTSRFTNNMDGTVKDTLTGLTWKRCIEGYNLNDNSTPADMTDDSCEINGNGSDTTFTWNNALALEGNSFAGQSTWRVPNLKELISITAYTKAKPSINEEVFPSTPNTITWSNSEHTLSQKAWSVNFTNGGDRNSNKTDSRSVRLVRD